MLIAYSPSGARVELFLSFLYSIMTLIDLNGAESKKITGNIKIPLKFVSSFQFITKNGCLAIAQQTLHHQD